MHSVWSCERVNTILESHKNDDEASQAKLIVQCTFGSGIFAKIPLFCILFFSTENCVWLIGLQMMCAFCKI